LSALSVRVTTNASGVASLKPIANTVAGSYSVSAIFGSTSAVFTLTNKAGAPAQVIATSGTPQAADIGSRFQIGLLATVRDAFGNAVPDVTVVFTSVRTSNAGAIFPAGNAAVTNASGQASVDVRANLSAGGYTVMAGSGSATPGSFGLTNTARPVAIAPALTSGMGNRLGIAWTNPLNTPMT
jgi:hypothetical protein